MNALIYAGGGCLGHAPPGIDLSLYVKMMHFSMLKYAGRNNFTLMEEEEGGSGLSNTGVPEAYIMRPECR